MSAIPATRLTDPDFVWVPSAQTDVTRIWRKYGWTPPSEARKALAFAVTLSTVEGWQDCQDQDAESKRPFGGTSACFDVRK